MTDHILKAGYDAKASRIIATTNAVDRDGEVVDPKGVRNLQEYLAKNPVILWQHDWHGAPVGKATGGKIYDDRIELSVEWAPTPMGREVKSLYDGGFMSSFSIGFRAKDAKQIDGKYTYTDWELLEVSAVSIPANPMANIIRTAEKQGVELTTIKGLYREAGTKPDEVDTEVAAVVDEVVDETPEPIQEKQMAENIIDVEAIRKEAADQARKEIEREMAEKAKEARIAELEKQLEAKEEARVKEAQAKTLGEFRDDAEIKVGATPEYKGINLRKGVEAFADMLERKGHREAAAKAVASDERTMGLIKSFHDMYKGSFTRDISEKAIDYASDGAGGYLSPDQFGDLLAYARLSSVALSNARVVNMTSDVMKMPRENAKVALAFTASTTEAGATSATFEQVTLTAGDLDGYADVSMHLEMDSTTPIAALLLDQFTEAYGQKIDSAVFAGTGSPVSGIFRSGGRSEVFGTGSTNFSAVLVSNLIAAEGKLEKPRRNGAKWYAGRSTIWSYIYPLKNTQGDHYLITDLSRPGARTLLGYPVEEVEEFPANAAATAMAVFGNLDGMIIGNRLGNLTLFRDPYSLSAKHYVRYVFWTRVAFANALPNNFVRIVTAA